MAGGVGVPEAASFPSATVPALVVSAVDPAGVVTAVEGTIDVGGGGRGVAEGTAVAVLLGSEPPFVPGSGSALPRLTAKKAMPPNAAAASSTAIIHTATLLFGRIPTSRGSMSLTLSSAPKLSVLP